VSRLFPERLALALYPDRLAWLKLGNWRTRRVEEKGEMVFEAHPAAMIQTVEQVVHDLPAKSHVSIVLSNRLVRYTCVPNPDEGRNASERLMLARHMFASIHGAAAEHWDIALSHSALGKGALASAVDASLIAGLRDVLKLKRLHLASLQPYLMAAFNMQRKALSKRAGLFSVAEPGRLCCVAWRDAGWTMVQQAHLEPDGSHEEGLLPRMRGMTGLIQPESVHVTAPEFASFHTDGLAASPLQWLPGLSPTQDYAWGGAMLGAVQ